MKKFLLLLLCAGCGAVLAAEDDITFHGTLMSPPACSISGGQTIEVQFRDLIIDDINGNYGRKEVPYELTCDSTTRNELRLGCPRSRVEYDTLMDGDCHLLQRLCY